MRSAGGRRALPLQRPLRVPLQWVVVSGGGLRGLFDLCQVTPPPGPPQSAGRLVASPGMGTAYKVFAIAHGDVGMEGVAGFGKAPLLEATSPAVEAEADDDGPDPAAGRTIRKVRVPSK